MKRNLLYLLVVLFSATAYGQAPNQMNYQGIARNTVGNVLPNKNINVRLSVRDGSVGGPVVYREVRSITTSRFGMFNIAIGSAGATSVTGSMATINWSAGAKFLQVEIDPAGGSSFMDLGATQLLSVPYALFAGNGAPSGPAGGDLIGLYPNPTLADNSVGTSKIADGSVTSAKIAAGVIPTSLPPDGTAGGDLTGSYPNPGVSKIQGVTVNTTGASSGQVLKFNGTQWAPGTDNGGALSGPAGGDLAGTYPDPTISNNAITTAKIADGSVTASKIAAGVIPTSLPPNGTAGGDLNGSYPNPGVTRIQGVTVSTTGATTGQVLKFNGTQWAPGTDNSGTSGGLAGGDLSGTYPDPTISNNAVTTAKIADGSVTASKLAVGVIPTSLPPNGAAGGDLAGTYPNPAVGVGAITTTKLADNSITTPKIVDASVTASKLAAGVIPTSLPPNGAAGGDLAGTYPNPAVGVGAITTTKLADNSITTSKIVDASVTASKLAAGVIPTSLPPNGAAGGDLAGTYPNPAVNSIRGIPVINTVPTSGQVLKFNGTQWAPGTDNGGSGSTPSGPAGGDLSGNYPDPSIASGAVTTPKIANGAIVTPKLADDAVNSNKLADNAVTTSKILDGAVTAAKLAAGVIPTSLPPTGAAGGDLSGSYPNPGVSKISGVTVTTTGASAGQVLKYNGTQWVPGTDNGGSGGSPTGPAGGDLSGTYPNPTIGTGVITTSKLADNSVTTSKIVDASVTTAKIAAGVIPTSLPPNGAASGDLSGSYPSPSVNKIQGVTVNNTAPSSGQVLKFNGTQWAPATDDVGSGGGATGPAGGDLSGTYPNPTIGTGVITTTKLADNSVTTSKIVDASVTAAKIAAGVIPTSLPPNGAAGGDLSGSYPNPGVSKISGVTVTTTGATAGQVLKYNGTQWAPATDDVGSGGGATGPAGGDLSGTYPNPTIGTGVITTTKLADNSITTSKIVDASVTAAKIAAGVIPTSLPPNGAAGGDLLGTYPNPSVNKIQGVTINNTAPLSGQVLKFNGTQWIPATDNTAFSLPYSQTFPSASSLIGLTNSGAGAGLEGINSSTNANAFGVVGRITSTAPGASSAAIRGINNGLLSNGIGIWGSHDGTGFGVYGTSVGNDGVHGFSTNGNGVFGTSNTSSGGRFDLLTSNNSPALVAYTEGTGMGVNATSEQGYGVWGVTYNPASAAIYGANVGGGESIVGITNGAATGAVVGKNSGDNGIGVLALANSDNGLGVFGNNGTALTAKLETGTGNLAVFKVGNTNKARIDANGKGYFNGGTQNSGADIAEAFDVEGSRNEYEPGDVLIISQNSDRKVEKSSSPYSTLVAGVFATKPGVLLTEKNAEEDQLDETVPMGVIGIIPTKVCLEGGGIKRGDLIVTSSLPGVAMKANPDKVKVGQVIGKALQDYNSEGVGKINILVSIK